MNPENLPKAPNDQYDPNLDAQDEEVTSGGNNKLLYMLSGVVLALVIGYVALPKGDGSSGGLASVTPTFMLEDAAVTGTIPTSADSIAAGLKAAPIIVAETEAATKTTPRTRPENTPSSAAPAAVAAAPAVVEEAPEPVAAPAPVVAPAAPAAPTMVTVSGKIQDENGRPLIGATVLLKGSSKGTSTDANGNYSMEVPNTDNTLVYGYGGYEDETVRNSGSKSVNMTLTPRAKAGRKRR